MEKLTPDNFKTGFLVDADWMAGVAEDPSPDAQSRYSAFILRPETGEYLGYWSFETLCPALEAVNRFDRPWRYESVSGCVGCDKGQCKNNEQGKCAIGGCGGKKQNQDT
jgi:hypothetical protein